MRNNFMFWFVATPFLVTVCLGVIAISVATWIGPRWKGLRSQWFLAGALVSLVFFIPTCGVVMWGMDPFRFGEFRYDSYDEVRDPRIRHSLPTTAIDIVVQKEMNGYRARYTINKADLLSYLDSLWEDHGETSALARDGLGTMDELRDYQELSYEFDDLNWPVPEKVSYFISPISHNGAGSHYYFAAESETAYQRTSQW